MHGVNALLNIFYRRMRPTIPLTALNVATLSQIQRRYLICGNHDSGLHQGLVKVAIVTGVTVTTLLSVGSDLLWLRMRWRLRLRLGIMGHETCLWRLIMWKGNNADWTWLLIRVDYVLFTSQCVLSVPALLHTMRGCIRFCVRLFVFCLC